MRIFAVKVVVFLAVCAAGAENFAPVVLYSPDARITTGEFTRALAPGDTISDSAQIATGRDKLYLLACPGQILEFSKGTEFVIYPQDKKIALLKGTMTIHTREEGDTLCYSLEIDSAVVRFASPGQVFVPVGDSLMRLIQGEVAEHIGYTPPPEKWYKSSQKDGRYLFSLLDDGKIPGREFAFEFPSARPKFFRQYVRGHSGYATYRGEKYYWGGLVYQMYLWKIKFVYDLWFAYSFQSGFYRDWAGWEDWVDHIKYIEVFRRGDPVFLRVGLIENKRYGHGLLVDNYNNAVFLPFEKLNGAELNIDLANFKADAFINDVKYPALFGGYAHRKFSDRLSIYIYAAGETDILRGIEDTDGDGYPDDFDPQPDVFNTQDDSVIATESPPNIRERSVKRQLFGVGTGAKYKFINREKLSAAVSGELTAMTTPGVGISLPNLSVGTEYLTFGIGTEFQTPKFVAGVFDGNYEAEKVRFVADSAGRYTMTTLIDEIAEEEGWLYGWNYSLSLGKPEYAQLTVRFRDIYRSASRDEHFYVALLSNYKFSRYVSHIFAFVDQKNVSQILRRKTDGERWGLEIAVLPHRAVKVKLRYREQYEDKNSDGFISGSEIHRNFSGSVILDGTYWWHRFLEWVRKKDESESG